MIQSKSKIISQIKEESLKSENIFVATDPDREGEAIAYHIVSIMDEKSKLRLKEYYFMRLPKGDQGRT